MKTAHCVCLVAMALAGCAANAQFDLQESHTTASLRGIDALGAGVAWASGSEGTVLRTEDAGIIWQRCTVPAGAGKLDFRAVQGFDAQTALVMAAGKGASSRIYKTTDGCQTWKLMLTNPDADGFWDAMRFDVHGQRGMLWGDPVAGGFVIYETRNGGERWTRSTVKSLGVAAPGIGGFAASNSSLGGETLAFVTSGPGGPFFYLGDRTCATESPVGDPLSCVRDAMTWKTLKLPMEGGSASAGAFSLAERALRRVVVGGDYSKPDDRQGTAAYSEDGGLSWASAKTMPGGYRSAVTYDAKTKTWLAVGTNGADLSFDDGRNWLAVAGESVGGWNAISLPYVVGVKGRIGRVREELWQPHASR